MNVKESAFLFDCEGDELVGIISMPARSNSDLGVLILVGGPQYRVGSHRQFVLLARDLAQQGLPCLRFDYRGMGDASGEGRDFEHVEADIRAAIDAFCTRVPGLRRVVLWGLCDGASAACFYVPIDDRVAGTVLLNPWVNTPAGEARTYLKHYYLRRVFDPAFWKKLFGGGVSIGRALGGFVGAARSASAGRRRTPASENPRTLPDRMARGLRIADQPCCIVLSGRDYVAREFEGAVVTGEEWAGIDAVQNPFRLDQADHTFSSAAWRSEVAQLTADWVLGVAHHGGEKAK